MRSRRFRQARYHARLYRQNPWYAVMDVTGDHTLGGHDVPKSWWEVKVPSYDGTFLHVSGGDDGREVVVHRIEGDPADSRTWNEWSHVYLSMSRGDARRFWWVLTRFFVTEWFGLRRWLYFVALRRVVRRWDKERPR